MPELTVEDAHGDGIALAGADHVAERELKLVVVVVPERRRAAVDRVAVASVVEGDGASVDPYLQRPGDEARKVERGRRPF